MTKEKAINYLELAVPITALTQAKYVEFIDAIHMAIEALKKPERAEGEWIVDEQGNAYCSECGLHTTKDTLKRIAVVGTNKPKFCPNCGAKMKGGAG